MMLFREALGLAFVCENDNVGFEESEVTMGRWWCDGWSVKGPQRRQWRQRRDKQGKLREGMNEGKRRVGKGFGVLK